ncbi:MAG: hypothetical protein HYR88_09110 [Verrucomicrobia bacterium]|nr:hypothetical protein [Verrucomicrobiota bacterium]MBI3869402.1 hypothetical protein [Verrucomicrobiota bacterium]
MLSACYAPVKPFMPSSNNGFWRAVRTHPLNRVLFDHPTRAWKVSDVVSRERFHRTEMFRLLYRPLRVDCEMAAAIPDPTHADRVMLVSMHRWRSDFSERDRAILNLALPHIAKTCWKLLRTESPQAIVRENQSEPWERESFADRIRSHGQWGLTKRELEVLFWVCQGKTNSEIGRILGISERTAETHALRSYPKLGVENRFAAITTLNRLMRTPPLASWEADAVDALAEPALPGSIR